MASDFKLTIPYIMAIVYKSFLCGFPDICKALGRHVYIFSFKEKAIYLPVARAVHTAWDGSLTFTGTLLVACKPLPSCPLSPRPHDHSEPSSRTPSA